jgi:hypothetical protein
VIGHVQAADDDRHQRQGEPGRLGGEPAEQAEGERAEVVGHLVLGQLVGPQPDDRQHSEQAQAEPEAHSAVEQHRADRHHADVHAK